MLRKFGKTNGKPHNLPVSNFCWGGLPIGQYLVCFSYAILKFIKNSKTSLHVYRYHFRNSEVRLNFCSLTQLNALTKFFRLLSLSVLYAFNVMHSFVFPLPNSGKPRATDSLEKIINFSYETAKIQSLDISSTKAYSISKEHKTSTAAK